MVLFKINGERNSGTNFLEQLLYKNGFPIYCQNIKENVCYHWKHGIPGKDLKSLDKNVIDIFIFRNLEEWLISMSKNPYHLKPISEFDNFLTTAHQSTENFLLDYRTNKFLNEDDNDKTIFQIRYYKFNKIIEYTNIYKNTIFVNLCFLQNKNNALSFLSTLNDKFLKKKINYLLEIEDHTKDIKAKSKNRDYDIVISNYQDIINKNINNDIENFINNLTFEIYEESSLNHAISLITKHIMNKLLDERELCDLECLVTGVFAPLTSYMNQLQYEECLEKMSVDSNIFPIPIILSVDGPAPIGAVIELKNGTGVIHATLLVKECWIPDLEKECVSVFGCFDDNHPYIKYLCGKPNLNYVSGELTIVNTEFHNNFLEFRKTPLEMRALGPWTGFQTRNPLHRSHIELIKNCSGNSKILLHPVEGVTQECDIPFPVRMACYQKVIGYLGDSALSILPLSMRMAGPREAVWHAVIRRNYGCSHFIVGRDHAGPSYRKKDGASFFHPLAAQQLAKSLESRLGLTILTSEELVYCENTGVYKELGKVVGGTDIVKNISGTQFRSMLEANKEIPSWYSYPEVVDVLRAYYNKPVGICYYFVGLSGSGKSTYAEALKGYFEENMLEVTLLDADVIRANLSKGLGFSKEDRSMNVRRIGYVASEIVRHGGIVIVANIAPFHEDRAFNRNIISQHGKYVEIFVDTPLNTCADRDVKGLYKAAFAGTLKNFTGVSDPFEAPINTLIVTPIAKDQLAVPLRAYLPNLRFKNKVLVLGGTPQFLRFLNANGHVTNDPDGNDSLSCAYPDSALVKEFNPVKTVYCDFGNGCAIGFTNDISANFLSSPIGSLAEHKAAWTSVKNVLFVKETGLLEEFLGLTRGSCAEFF